MIHLLKIGNKTTRKEFEFEKNERVGYIITETYYEKQWNKYIPKKIKVFKIGYWDGEKAIFDDGKLIVRKKEWLFKIEKQLGYG